MIDFFRIIYPDSSDLEFEAGLKFLYKFWIITISVIVVILLSSMCKIFKKAGEKPWKALIPGYNILILYKISELSPLWLLFGIGLFIPSVKTMCYLAFSFVRGTQKAMLCHKFNKSLAFTIGMILFDFIFYPILAFGKSKYDKDKKVFE